MVLPLLQVGKARKCREILEGWAIEGTDNQPGLLKILESSRTSEVTLSSVR